MEELKEIILELIALKQEGNFWDFKREWHNNNCDLLHDIICMANNLVNRDCYIIIGIDEENDYSFFNLQNSKRRTTKDIVDFLKTSNFVSGIRPTVFIKTLFLGTNEIDVIVIKDDYNTPYFLTKEYRDKEMLLLPYYIYTRIMDTNTAKNSSADIDKIEYLWRKRFRLNESPLEQVKELLKDKDNWIETPVEGLDLDFYKYKPEFTIKYNVAKDRTGYEFFLFSQCDSRPHWYDIQIKYHQTVLEDIGGASLDGGRCFIVTPESTGFSWKEYDNWEYTYVYFIKESLMYSLNIFLYKEESESYKYAWNRFIEVVLVFEDEKEQLDFHDYILANKKMFNKYYTEVEHLPHFPDLPNYNMNIFKERYRTALALQKMLLVFRR